MELRLVENPDYIGEAGAQQVRSLQQALTLAMASQDWSEVRRLDKACAALVEKIIAANTHDGDDLLIILRELKDVYSDLICNCRKKVASMAV
jgi:flagellar protein FliT